jgi:5-methyltetrahydrofolate--homocysteine methyltransferase
MVKHYGAAVIALPNDHDEIPMKADKRLELTKKILGTAVDVYGLTLDDIVIDALAMPIGADPTIVNVAYETISRIREEFGVNMTLGASNVSFGMPGRHAINATFLPMAMRAGLTSAIMDARTPQVVEAVKAADLLLGHDEWGGAWIAAYRARLAAQAAEKAQQAVAP